MTHSATLPSFEVEAISAQASKMQHRNKLARGTPKTMTVAHCATTPDPFVAEVAHRFKLQNLSPQATKTALRNGKVPIMFDKIPAVSNANNDATPFICLPQEIKNDIYKLVLGGHFLHIWTRRVKTRSMLYHQVCRAGLSEAEAQEACQKADPDSWYVNGVTDRHRDCYEGDVELPSNVNISLLHVCRRIYHEARFIAFSSNIFSFPDASVMREFIHQINQSTDFNLAIRRINLNMDYFGNRITGLDKAIGILVNRMKHLEHISISLDQPMNWSTTNEKEKKVAAMQPMFNCLMRLRKLPLKTMTVVVVSDKTLENYFRLPPTAFAWFHPERYWRVGESREWVHTLKKAFFE